MLDERRATMTLRTLTEDQVVVIREAPAAHVGLGGSGAYAKGVSGGSDADQGDADHGTDADSSDRGDSDHSADSDSGPHDRGQGGKSTTTPIAPDSSDRAPSQPR